MQTNTIIPIANIAAGEKSKARDIIAAIRTLQSIEQEKRPATETERQLLGWYGTVKTPPVG